MFYLFGIHLGSAFLSKSGPGDVRKRERKWNHTRVKDFEGLDPQNGRSRIKKDVFIKMFEKRMKMGAEMDWKMELCATFVGIVFWSIWKVHFIWIWLPNQLPNVNGAPPHFEVILGGSSDRQEERQKRPRGDAKGRLTRANWSQQCTKRELNEAKGS